MQKTKTMREYEYYVGGGFKKSNSTIEVIDPATEEVFAKIFQTSRQDLAFAIEIARSAQSQWRATSFKERAKVLRQIAALMLENLQSLAEIGTKEIGKPLKESLFVDIPLGADAFNYYASFLESLEEEAVGVIKGYLPNSKLNLNDLYEIIVSLILAVEESESETIKNTALSVLLDGVKKEVKC